MSKKSKKSNKRIMGSKHSVPLKSDLNNSRRLRHFMHFTSINNKDNKYFLKDKLRYHKLNFKKTINYIFMMIGYVSSIITICSLFIKQDDAISIENYQKGIIYYEDGYLEEASQCFAKAYKINHNLLDIKFYYAYTEYLLENFDKSFKILEENRNTLSANELALYASYTYKRGEYKKSEEYLQKIHQPENLNIHAFIQYIITSTNLSFRESYNEGVSTLYANITLLDAKFNETKQLPATEKVFNVDEDTGLALIQNAKEVAERINENTNDNVLILQRCRLCMYLQFIAHSFKYEKCELSVYILEEAADLIDFTTNYDMSIKFVEAICFYSVSLKNEPVFPVETENAIKIIVKKFNEIELLEEQAEVKILTEYDRNTLKMVEVLLKDIENNCLNKDNFDIELISSKVPEGDYEISDTLKIWADGFLDRFEAYLYIRLKES